MIESIPIRETLGLEDYAEVVHLTEAVRCLREEAAQLVPELRGRKVWMVNSTAKGGGVAEMLPKLVFLLNELGVDTEWVVMSTDQPGFFDLTKRLHNLIHGHGDPGLQDEHRQLYAAVSSENAAELKQRIGADDVLVIHDPQPLGMGALLKGELGMPFLFRCHIGLDEDRTETRAAWNFLRPYAEACDHAIFSCPEYIPGFLAGKSGIITPAIDPLSFKNRELSPHKLAGILKNSGLVRSRHPVVPAAYDEQATRLRPDGSFAPLDEETEIGILFRPLVTQVSRWDRLKGFEPLLDAFVALKQSIGSRDISDRHRRRLNHVRLVMAGPDPAAVADDPEAQDVLRDLIEKYQRLPHWLQEDVALVSLPMGSREENALMVNALQHSSSVVVQNSLREGFGLTVTEAMWKQRSVLGSRACGVRAQIRDGVDGHLIPNSEDPQQIADLLDATLDDLPGRLRSGRSAQRRVHDEFLIFTQVRRWLATLANQLRR
ncbi:MAG: glycosyltransferase [Myxococcota bacterium]|nr:glycosyltransferase [Myxococcota bacterium]